MEHAYDDDAASSVRVAVRVRPLIGREKVDRCDECVSVVEDEMQVVIGKNRSFTYDYVFSKYAQQSDIWKCVDPLVKAHFDGYNATIFAYGQTGSGKTYTMGSGSCVHVSPEEYGIIPRVISFLFEQVELKTADNPQYKAELRVRFLEVYGEEIRDLLVQFGANASMGDGASSDSKVTLREGENGEVQVVGASEDLVTDADECLRLLERGTLCRTTGSTLMNAHSSRSHAIFTVSMVQHIPQEPVGDQADGAMTTDQCEYETRTSYFNFVDLAGSERQKRTQAEGKRLKEGIDINKGLLALGNVISALGDDKKRGKVHVPYRDSKLTRMLQDSLGGNSRTLMLTCVSPADVNFEETLNALKYANRARNIKNKPVINRDETSAMTAELRRQVQMLQAEVHRLRNPGLSDAELKLATVGTTAIGMAMDFDSYGNLRSRAETAENEVARLTAELKRNRTQMDHMKEEMIAALAERDYLRLCVEESNDGGETTTNAEDREAKSNILKQHLRTICELQDQLRAVERERDRAVMNLSDSGLLSASVAVDTTIQMSDALLARAEKEIEKESARLQQLKQNDDDAMREASDAEDDTESDNVQSKASQEEEADRQRVFQRRQQHLGQSVQDLAHEISLKEQLMQNIRQNQENYERMKSYYEQKMAQMVEEVRITQLDRDKLIDEIHQLELKMKQDGDVHGNGNGRLAKLSKDLKQKELELQNLRKKQSEMNRYMNQKKKNEMQLRVLNAEITNMKRQKVELIRKMQDERKRYEEEASRRQREIQSLKRAQQRDKQQIQRLGTQKEAQERVLKRKMEEISAAKARLKHQQQLQAQARRMNASYSRHKAPSKSEQDAKWLSDEVKKRAEEQQKLEQLQKEREAVAKEMEALYAARDRLEDELRKSLANQSNIRDVLISPMKTSPIPTPGRRLSGSGRQEVQLTPAEEQLLYDLEERIEACQAQLEYKEEKISEIADGDRRVDGLQGKIEGAQSLPEARTLLKMLFGMAVDVKKQDQRKEQEIAKLQVEMNDLIANLEQERSKTEQMRLNYEESLQRVLHTSGNEPMEADASRERILLSVSEERNAILRKQCDELESTQRQIEQAYASLQANLNRERQETTKSKERIEWLEKQLAELRSSSSSISNQSAQAVVSHSPTTPALNGPVSWANEFNDDEDDDVAMDEGDERAEQADEETYDARIEQDDVEMKDDDEASDTSPRQSSARRNRYEFRVDLNHMESNMDSISLANNRQAQTMTPRHQEDDDDAPSLKEDSPTFASDDATASSSSASIFSRLSNPTNFTGIHKNRVKDSASKREILQLRAERNRARRVRDRGTSLLRPPRAMTPTDRTSVSAFPTAVKAPTVKKPANPMLEVLANMKRENESEQLASMVSPSFATTRARSQTTGSSHGSDSAADETTEPPPTGIPSLHLVMPPPAPTTTASSTSAAQQLDVYSRLAGQYTASAQNKRQKAVPPTRRLTKSASSMEDKSPPDKSTSRSGSFVADDETIDMMPTETTSSESYDPLLGGGSLVAQVHDDYRERLSHRHSTRSS